MLRQGLRQRMPEALNPIHNHAGARAAGAADEAAAGANRAGKRAWDSHRLRGRIRRIGYINSLRGL